MSKYKIVLIVPYFGEFPNFFQLWLNSCKYNETVDWIIFTDNKKKYNYPNNVHVKYIEFQQLKDKIQSKFEFKIVLDSPYKLCDYKPAYGHIFEEYIKEYDFWGHCDVDLIWGNIRKFVTDDILDKYDRLFSYGHFVLYRNSYEVCRWYKTLDGIGDITYKKVYTDSESYCFDEGGGKTAWGGMNKIVENAKKRQYDNVCFDDIIVKYKNFCSGRTFEKFVKSDIKPYKLECAYSFNEGLLLQHLKINNKIQIIETMYVHFQKRKMKMNVDLNNAEKFIMVPNKFIGYKEIDEKLLNKECKYRFINLRYILLRYNNLKKKIKKIKIYIK